MMGGRDRLGTGAGERIAGRPLYTQLQRKANTRAALQRQHPAAARMAVNTAAQPPKRAPASLAPLRITGLLDVFPQKRKRRFYPQCTPLSSNATAGLDSYPEPPLPLRYQHPPLPAPHTVYTHRVQRKVSTGENKNLRTPRPPFPPRGRFTFV